MLQNGVKWQAIERALFHPFGRSIISQVYRHICQFYGGNRAMYGFQAFWRNGNAAFAIIMNHFRTALLRGFKWLKHLI